MQKSIVIPSVPLQALHDDVVQKHDIRLFILRTDLNHPFISGNKLFKLKYNIEEAQRTGKNTLLTFGGAYSNHIAATAAAGNEKGFNTIGIIRGDELSVLNPTLQLAKQNGMQLHYVSRHLYKGKTALYDYVNTAFGHQNFYMIPEGGSNQMGIKGCNEITQHVTVEFDTICCACGTGATITGIIQTLNKNQQAIGFQVLKGEDYIKTEVQQWLNNPAINNWQITTNYHFGGYGKIKNELVAFINQFYQTHQIPLDFVYTGKMMFGIYDLIKKGHFKKGQTIVAIHTGGLQGNQGFTANDGSFLS